MELLCTRVRIRVLSCFGGFVRPCSEKKQLRDERLLEKRRVFKEQEALREAGVRDDLLTPEERTIRKCHTEAVERGHFTYNDPVTNQREYTRLRHYLRGACCGSACRHCIYDHVKVPPGKFKTRRFNSSFWVYDETDSDDINDEYMMSLRIPKLRPNRPQ